MKKEIAIGQRVEFDDAQEGPQRGVITGILGNQTTAIVEVDFSLAGVSWNVPIVELTPLKKLAA